MFDNIGTKIKTCAMVACWIGIISSVICGFILISYDATMIGVLLLVLGPFVSWLGSLTLYGFGQLIENSDILVEQTQPDNDKSYSYNYSYKKTEQNENAQPIQQNPSKYHFETNSPNDIKLTDNDFFDIICPNCKRKLSFLKDDIESNKTFDCPECYATLKFTLNNEELTVSIDPSENCE